MTTKLLLSRIEEYCRKEGISLSTFGRRAVNDGKLVARLRSGSTITLETAEKINRLIAGKAAA